MGMIIPDTNFQSAGETMEHPCLRKSKEKSLAARIGCAELENKEIKSNYGKP